MKKIDKIKKKAWYTAVNKSQNIKQNQIILSTNKHSLCKYFFFLNFNKKSFFIRQINYIFQILISYVKTNQKKFIIVFKWKYICLYKKNCLKKFHIIFLSLDIVIFNYFFHIEKIYFVTFSFNKWSTFFVNRKFMRIVFFKNHQIFFFNKASNFFCIFYQLTKTSFSKILSSSSNVYHKHNFFNQYISKQITKK